MKKSIQGRKEGKLFIIYLSFTTEEDDDDGGGDDDKDESTSTMPVSDGTSELSPTMPSSLMKRFSELTRVFT